MLNQRGPTMTTLNNTRPLASASEIAAHYGRPIKSNGNYQIRCPCHAPHEGQGQNLSVKDAPGGGLLVHCFSRGCSFNDILAAFRRDGLTVSREWTYPGGKMVRRTDSASIPKGRHFKGSPGSTKGVPLLIRGDSPGALIVITEGESDADAVLSSELAKVAAGCFPGGADNAGSADYSAVRGRRVAIWTDNDAKGATAQQEAAKAVANAGAASVELVRMVGPDGEGQGAANCPPTLLEIFVEGRKSWEGPAVLDFDVRPEVNGASADIPARYDWLWRDLGTFADIPAPVQLVNGLVILGNVSLWYAPPKTGKTRMLFGMLKSLAPGGPQFLGLDLPDVAALLFTEEPPNVIGERVRDYAMPKGVHIANEAAALAMKPDDFAEVVYQEYQTNGGSFGLIAVDAVGPFINCGDWNDYESVKTALAPIRQLARLLPTVAILLTHHQNKGGGSGMARGIG